jgi:hypothetical protein
MSKTVHPKYAKIGEVKVRVRKVVLDISGRTVERAMVYTSQDIPVGSAEHRDVVLYMTRGRLTLEDYSIESMGDAGVLEATRTDLSGRSSLFEDVDPYEDVEDIEGAENRAQEPDEQDSDEDSDGDDDERDDDDRDYLVEL